MKRVKITFEAIVEDEQVKQESDILADGYADLEDAILTGGLDEVIDGSYEYHVNWEISDVELAKENEHDGE